MSTDGGTDQSLVRVFEQYRELLFSIAYRMLGSQADAEDMVQETFVRWQNQSSKPVRNPRSLLVTIVSRLCINHLNSARVRREEYFGEWLPEPIITWHPNEPSAGETGIDDFQKPKRALAAVENVPAPNRLAAVGSRPRVSRARDGMGLRRASGRLVGNGRLPVRRQR